MTQGFVSNYNDSGYTISGTFYDQNNALQTNYTVSSADVYVGNPEAGVGVWMINGNYNNNCSLYPVMCSTGSLDNINVPTDSDNAWLLYPGYGMKLYYNPNYNIFVPGTSSLLYYNTSTDPVVLGCNGWTGGGQIVVTTGFGLYAAGNTNSIKVYFRGTEVPAQPNLTT